MGRATTRRKKPIVIDSSDDDEDSTQHSPAPTPPKLRSREAVETTKQKPISASARAFSAKSSSQVSSQQKSQKSSQAQASKPQTKTKSKTIHSFFNAATQKQQKQSQATSSPEKIDVDAIVEEEDLISDGSIDEELGKLADTQTQAPTSQPKLALALRKRTRGAFEQETGSNTTPSGSQKFRKVSDGTKAPSTTDAPISKLSAEDLRPWTEKYAPVNLEELAVHKKKVADVRSWLAGVFAGQERKRLLVLKGAAGTGKTTTMSLLAKDLGFDINEWKNPIGADFGEEGYVSAAAQFEEFIGRSGRFQTLQFEGDDLQPAAKSDNSKSDNNQIIMMEEFPNTFTRSSTAVHNFRSIINQYLATNVPSTRIQFSGNSNAPIIPLVMIISETSLSAETFTDSFTAHRLLGPEITMHPGVTVIEFNAVAPTYLSKALDLIVLKEARETGRRQTPGPQVIKQLAEIGDIRSAVSALEFLCVRGDEKDNAWSGRIAFTKPKGASKKNTPLSRMEEESLAIITQRESALGIFHSVGKVVYNKRDTQGTPPQPPEHLSFAVRPKAPETDPDGLFNEIGTDCSTYVAALHENYVLSCNAPDNEQTQDSINGCIDALSNADLLSPDRFGGRRVLQGSGADNFRQEEISFQVGVRGLLFSLPFPVKRLQLPGSGKADAFKIMFPTSIKLWRQREEVEGMLDVWVSRAQNGQLKASSSAPPRAGGVETWRRNNAMDSLPPPNAARSGQKDENDGSALLASGSSAKQEMLLEKLPYMALLERRRSPGSQTLREMEKVTRFTGIGRQDDDTPEEDEQQGSLLAIRRKAFGNGLDKRGSTSASSGVGDMSVQGLVLSDDDIEDD